ncbi:MAG TPA: hypothetical protein VN878_01050 [Usitatibacter sp.]|nr:hypothetical protein [Usitatibacter sp.]
MSARIKGFLTAIGLLSALCGCATLERLTSDVRQQATKAVASLSAQREASVTVRTEEGLHISAIAVGYEPPARGIVTLGVSQLPLYSVLSAIAQGAGLSVAYQFGVDSLRPVSVDLREVNSESAIREVAYAAGYIAVFERPKAVTIAREATLTFRVPARVLKTLQTRYTVSNGAASIATPVGASMAALAGSAPALAGHASASNVSVSSTSLQDAATLKAFLQALCGAEPSILAEEGIIAAHGNAAQLRRLQAFLDYYVRESLAQVEVELSVVEVTLASEFASGIDWKRVIAADTLWGAALGGVQLRAGPDFAAEAFSVQATSRSIDSVVRALEQFTTINELTRPKVIAMNHAQTIYRASVQRPYLPTASANVTTGGISTTVQSTASLSYAEEGVTFGVQAHIIDAHRVELTIVPILSTTQRIDTFQISRDVTLSAPVQPRQDAYLQVLAEHGKTMLIGGLRASAGVERVSGIPGAVRVPGLNLVVGGHNDRVNAREVVLLLHARIIPAPRVSTLIGESV